METENTRKLKLLKLLEILQHETDEQHPMKTQALCDRLTEEGIFTDRRTLATDIACLIDQGYEIQECNIGHSKAFFLSDNSFSIAELKVLIDAVQASNLLTDEQTVSLTNKLASLGGTKQKQLLRQSVVRFNTKKHTNPNVYHTVEVLADALQKKQKVRFVYFHMDENKNKVYHGNHGEHLVDPIAMVYNDGNYYLTCYNPDSEQNYNYRLDRIESISIEKEHVSENAVIRRRSIDKYHAAVFRMYGGTHAKVTLHFTEEILDCIYDAFGEQIRIRRIDDTWLEATAEVQISPTFFGWLMQFSSSIRIAAPDEIADEYRQWILSAVTCDEGCISDE